uniref:Uncharacterized protein n=1 Tax=Schistocephalus solidus TaxID=70667 RepID=A0A0X3QHR0_SCHSO
MTNRSSQQLRFDIKPRKSTYSSYLALQQFHLHPLVACSIPLVFLQCTSAMFCASQFSFSCFLRLPMDRFREAVIKESYCSRLPAPKKATALTKKPETSFALCPLGRSASNCVRNAIATSGRLSTSCIARTREYAHVRPAVVFDPSICVSTTTCPIEALLGRMRMRLHGVGEPAFVHQKRTVLVERRRGVTTTSTVAPQVEW